MAQVLSQDEIDALLGGLDEVAEQTESPKDEKTPGDDSEIMPYDFRQTAYLSGSKFPAFAIINDYFNRGLRSTMSSILRVMVDSTVVPIEIISFRDFLRRVPVPSSLHIMKMEPLRGHIMMVIDSKLFYSIVEIFLGSTSIGKSRIEGREFTSIEQRLIRRIVNSVEKDLEKAWQPIIPIHIQYVRNEINPQFAKIVQDDDVVVISKFQMDIEEISGVIHLCIPLSVLQPVKSKLMSTVQTEESEDPVWKTHLIHNLREAPVEIKVPLGFATISGRELLDLEEGDIIQLGTRTDDQLVATIKGQAKYIGSPGLYKGQKAFKIDRLIIPDEDFE